MITNITTDTATIILPGSSYAMFSKIESLNRELGAYVLVEVDYNTANFTKLDIDYSLVEYDDIADATLEAQQVYNFVLDYLDIKDEVDVYAWTKEKEAYLAERRAEDIAFYQDWLEEFISNREKFNGSEEEYQAKIDSLTRKLALALAA